MNCKEIYRWDQLCGEKENSYSTENRIRFQQKDKTEFKNKEATLFEPNSASVTESEQINSASTHRI